MCRLRHRCSYRWEGEEIARGSQASSEKQSRSVGRMGIVPDGVAEDVVRDSAQQRVPVNLGHDGHRVVEKGHLNHT